MNQSTEELNVLKEEHRRVKSKLWDAAIAFLKGLEGNYNARVAIEGIKDYDVVKDMNDSIFQNNGPTLGIGYNGSDILRCNLDIVRRYVPDAYPMFQEHTEEEIIEAELLYQMGAYSAELNQKIEVND